MTTIHSGDIDCPIAPFLSISSARFAILDPEKAFNDIECAASNRKKGRPTSYKDDIAQYVPNIPNNKNKFRPISPYS